MNLLRNKLRRTTAVVAGSIVGLAGVVALAAPASAHSPTVSGTSSCADGDWAVDWKFGNDYGSDATVTSITAVTNTGAKVAVTGDITTAASIPAYSGDRQNNAAAAVSGHSVVKDHSADDVTVTVILFWPKDGYTNDGKNGHGAPYVKTVPKPDENCTPTTPASPSETPSTSPTPTPSETTPALPVPTPSTSESTPADFTPIVEMDCTTITIGMDNPANGIEWRMHFKTTKGEERDLTIKPGEKKSEMFSAVPGFKVTVTLSVTVEGKTYSDFTTIDYTKPSNCDDSGSGGGLPVTGAAAGGIAGGAAVLLAIGVVLFVLARRRKVKFTA